MRDLFLGSGIAHSILILAITIGVGLYLGKIKIKGVSIGGTWILFFGLALSHFGITADSNVLAFVKDFGLILFVFSIGMQVGPGFFSSFKSGGISMNLMATLMVLLAGVMAIVISKISGESLQNMVGVMSGAVTNTPGLGAAEQTLTDILVKNSGANPLEAATSASNLASAYAVAYPIGVLGVIGLLILFKNIFNVDIDAEKTEIERKERESTRQARRMHLAVTNPAIFGKTIGEIHSLAGEDFIVSRVMRSGAIKVGRKNIVLQEGDLVLVVTYTDNTDEILNIFGVEVPLTKEDWDDLDTTLITSRLTVTNSSITGKTLKQLNADEEFGVNITRIYRAGLEIMARPGEKLHVGDDILVVGSEEGIKGVASVIGNRTKDLTTPYLIPIFTGIALGIILGMVPIAFPGIPQPVKLGLAGGPLIVAILIGYFGPKIGITTYATQSSNMMMRELGINLFLAAVGLSSGANFASALAGGGWWWILYGALITLVPVSVVCIVARYVMKFNFFQICGLVAGSCTNPPALSFSQSQYGAEYISSNYATVYPLSMFLRVLVAQLLILIAFAG